MNIRKISIVLAIIVIVGALFAARLMSSKGEEKSTEEPKVALKKVNTIKIKNRVIDAPVNITGKLAAPQKVEVYAEVSGILRPSARRFKEGNQFAQGAVLISLDAEEASLNILSQKSTLLNAITLMMPDMKLDYPDAYPKWQKYLDEFDVKQTLKPFPEPSSDQEKYYVISNNIHTQYYAIKSQETRLRKYTIYAPFTGVVSESSVNPGTLVRVGQKLGEFINPYSFELEATVSLKDVDKLRVGDVVNLASEDIQGGWKGTIRRISSRMDAATQTVKVFIGLGGDRLREGMFLNGQLASNQIENSTTIPRSLLVNENKVYVLEKSKLKLQEVKIVQFIGNQVVVKGLSDNTVLVNESSKEFYEGMKVTAGK